MKVLFVTRKFPPSIGGMQLFAFDLYTSLNTNADIKLVKWGGSNKALPLIYPYLFFVSFMQLMRGGIEIIHLQDGMLAPIGLILSRLFKKPYVVVIHGLDITYASWIYKKVVAPAVSKADKVICISQAAAHESLGRGVKKNRIIVLPIAVNDSLHQTTTNKDVREELDIQSDTQLLLTVGRLVKRKGVEWFVTNVLPDLVKKHPSLIYLVVGEGPERSNIEKSIEDNKLTPNVRLLGKIEGDLYDSVYNQADIFVMPNINVDGDIEGFGLVLLEASLCKLPIVASNTEGITDAVAHDKNGILVNAYDSNGFSAAIDKFLQNSQYAKQFGEKSREYTLNNYNWNKIAEQYTQVYQDLCNK